MILATGARARTFPDIGLAPDGERVWTYREAMVPGDCPKSLLVVGSGAIGIEFASFYRALGAEVTVVEALPRILPVEDEEVSTAAQKAFEKRGIAFRVGAKVTQARQDQPGVALELEARRQDRDAWRPSAPSSRSASPPTSRTWAWRRWA